MRHFDMPAEPRVTEMSFPTRVVFGAGALAQLSEEASRLGLRRALLVSGPGEAALPVEETLRGCGLAYQRWMVRGGLEAELQEGAALFQSGEFDAVVAAGGGSALDAAKGLALLVNNPGPLSRYAAQTPPGALPPLIAVSTTPGGSEVSPTMLLRQEAGPRLLITQPPLMPTVAICDPQLCVSLSPLVTAATGLAVLAANLEAYLAATFHPLADALAIDGITRVARSLPTAVEDPGDLNARTDLLVAALQGAMASEKGAGVGRSLAHALSGLCQMPYALARAMVLASVMEFNRASTTARLARVALALGDNTISRQEVLAGNSIERVRKLAAEVGLPRWLRQAGVEGTQLDQISRVAFEDPAHRVSARRCSLEDLRGIVRAAY